MAKLSYLLLICSLVTVCAVSHAQDGANDPTFNPADGGFQYGVGEMGRLHAMDLLPDGRIVMAGTIHDDYGNIRHYIGGLLPDGFLDCDFNPVLRTNDTVRCIVAQPDGKFLVAGDFWQCDGATRRKIARLLSDGTLDPTFDPGYGANYPIHCVAVQADGKILIGGEFNTYGNADRNRIARLLANGELDTTFDPGSGAYHQTDDPVVHAIHVLTDGSILIAGQFTSYDGTPRRRIARLNTDGGLDTGFDPGTGANGPIYALAAQGDGKIMIGGDFTSYDGTARERIARVEVGGSLDTTFNPGTGVEQYYSTSVNSIVIKADGKPLIGGNFSNYDGTSILNIAALNLDGSLDTTFDVGSGCSGQILDMCALPDGKTLICGGVAQCQGVSRPNRIMRIQQDGNADPDFNPRTGPDAPIICTAVQPDGRILIGGFFQNYHGYRLCKIARLLPDGCVDTAFQTGAGIEGTDPYSIIQCIRLQPDGKILVGGRFDTYDGVERKCLFRLNPDGSLDESFIPDDFFGNDGHIYDIALQSDGKIVIAGDWCDGSSCDNARRLHPDGSLDESFDPYFPYATCGELGIQSTGDIIIGSLTLHRVDAGGNSDAAFADFIADLMDYPYGVYVVKVLPDDRILVSMGDTYTGAVFLRLEPNGAVDSTFAILDEGLHNILPLPDEKTIVTGSFNDYQGVPRAGLARVHMDGTLDESFDPGSGIDAGWYRSLSMQPDGNLIITGGFERYNGTRRTGIARIQNQLYTAVPERTAPTLSIFPNPTDHRANIAAGMAGPVVITITNIAGHVVSQHRSYAMMSGACTIDLEDEAPGIYMVKVQGKDRTMIGRLVLE